MFRSQAVFLTLLYALTLHAAGRLTATGTVVDESTKEPIAGATVLVHSAGVRTGYDQFCPTCYLDCGKRAVTDAEGRFSIEGLSPELIFTMLVVKDGYGSAFIRKHDPEKGQPAATGLKKRASAADLKQVVRGKVVDGQGKPVKEALISQQGIQFGEGRRFGDIDWIDLVAVSNREGEFEMAYGKPATAMVLEVAPRGMAPTLVTLATGGTTLLADARAGWSVRGSRSSASASVRIAAGATAVVSGGIALSLDVELGATLAEVASLVENGEGAAARARLEAHAGHVEAIAAVRRDAALTERARASRALAVSLEALVPPASFAERRQTAAAILEWSLSFAR